MKNKKLQWVLLPLVLLIWGAVGYKLYSGVQGEELPPVKKVSREQVLTVEEDSLEYVLSLNYPDPFLKNSRSLRSSVKTTTTTSKPKPEAKVKVTVKPTPVRWPDVAYKGQIEKRANEQALYIIEIDKVVYFMHKGMQQAKLTLLEVYPDSVQMQYLNREKKTFYRP